ncbi:unnamed protein product [Ilex paraguariensis]|uniref:Uncharacterized protein n=1 Tax=Ilex paraguariensis TaxID=185542 RepID=A0ABC8SVK2_9AQUA
MPARKRSSSHNLLHDDGQEESSHQHYRRKQSRRERTRQAQDEQDDHEEPEEKVEDDSDGSGSDPEDLTEYILSLSSSINAYKVRPSIFMRYGSRNDPIFDAFSLLDLMRKKLLHGSFWRALPMLDSALFISTGVGARLLAKHVCMHSRSVVLSAQYCSRSTVSTLVVVSTRLSDEVLTICQRKKNEQNSYCSY